MEENKLLFFLRSPLFLGNVIFEVIVVSLSALLAVPVLYSVFLFHYLGDFTPLYDFVDLDQLLQNLVFLSREIDLPFASKSFFSTFALLI